MIRKISVVEAVVSTEKPVTSPSVDVFYVVRLEVVDAALRDGRGTGVEVVLKAVHLWASLSLYIPDYERASWDDSVEENIEICLRIM